jgi:hypothetical protein
MNLEDHRGDIICKGRAMSDIPIVAGIPEISGIALKQGVFLLCESSD